MAYGTVNADVIQTSTSGGILGAGNASIMKNRIINGAMVVNQRGFNATITDTAANTYTLDRFFAYGGQASKFSVQQSTTAPVGFINSLLVTSLSSYTVGASETFVVGQQIEGLNIADLAWGTANAKTVTLSFQVYSSLTGTFGGALQNSAQNRSYPFSYTVSSANTWTTVSVTIAGDTSGTWLTTSGVGIRVFFGLGVGSSNSNTAGSWAAGAYWSATGATSVVGTSGATFYITGVQLEVGSNATGFEYVNYQTSLANCQRYFEVVSMNGLGGSSSTTAIAFGCSYKVQKRATPTVVNASTDVSLYSFYRPALGSGNPSSVLVSSDLGDSRNFNITLANFSGLTNNQAWVGRYEGLFNASAEL